MSGTVRLAEVLAEKDARIAELEAADAEDNLCLRTAIERNAELEAEVARLKEVLQKTELLLASGTNRGPDARTTQSTG